jgi:circadian clock protein KaiC
MSEFDETANVDLPTVKKCPTGIAGFDEITYGGLPCGRPTLVAGNAGAGKTLFAIEFLVRGATEFGENGVFVSFEETPDELAKNVGSLGFDLNTLEDEQKLAIEYIRVERSEIEETGEYDLEGLFIRLGFAIDSIGAKRIVLDTLESLFGGLSNEGILRAELRRLFRWLKDKGMTAIITAERGEGQLLTRRGLEEYVSDCVVVLDNRVTEQVATRRLRVMKYRGSRHGTNEYPFLIGENGFSVLPITSISLAHKVSSERISTGVPDLDEMLGGKGYYRGSSILISGTAGTGKSSLAAAFVKAACERGEKALYVAYEEAPEQIMRNMRSIGIDLQPCIDKGFLRIHAMRPSTYGLETHLTMFHRMVKAFHPSVVVIDPITNFIAVGESPEVKDMFIRLVDFLKTEGVTTLFTSLTHGGRFQESTDVGISSIIDTWILLRDIEIGGERNRGLHILKSRGMPHSNQVREFILSKEGIRLIDAYLGTEGVLTGSARLAQETKERAAILEREQEMESRRNALERRRKIMDAQIAALQAEFAADEDEYQRMINREELRLNAVQDEREAMAKSRKAEEENR